MNHADALDREQIFGIEWTAEYIEFFVDGKSMCRFDRGTDEASQTEASWPFDKPFYLILNIAVGGNMGGHVYDEEMPFLMRVDYVRVYQRIKTKY